MSSIIIKAISVAIMNFTAVMIAKKQLNKNNNIFSFKSIVWFLVSLLPTIIFFSHDYDFTTLLTFLILIYSLKKIFDTDIIACFVLTVYIMIISAIFDLIGSAIIVNYYTLEEIRKNLFIMLISNSLVSICTYCSFNIKAVKDLINKNIDKINNPKKRKIIIFFLFGYISIAICFYIASEMFIPSQYYFTINIVILLFIIMIFIYTNEIIKYDKLLIENNMLFECMHNIEEYQEQQDLKIHEYRNQLSKITSLTKDKKVINFLSDILSVDLTNDNYILGQIKYIPKGEIKSLIYYKLLVANKRELNLFVDISPKLRKEDFKLSSKLNRELSQLIGIYFDNAIEAASETKEKKISLEIYKIKENLIFVISNTYIEKVKLKNIKKKGYSTKGKNHGKGLYFANKIINQSPEFISDTKVVGKYFVQKLEIIKRTNAE